MRSNLIADAPLPLVNTFETLVWSMALQGFLLARSGSIQVGSS